MTGATANVLRARMATIEALTAAFSASVVVSDDLSRIRRGVRLYFHKIKY